MQMVSTNLGGAPSDAPAGPSVLLVEEDAPARGLYRAYLERAGFHVAGARSVREGRDGLRSQAYQAVVSDLWLPDGSALDLLRDTRREDPDLPLLVLTASPSVESAIGALEQGAHRYLCRPVSESRFVAEVRRATQRCGRARARRRMLDDLSQRESEASRQDRHLLDEALAGLWLAAQPIVSVSRGGVVAYELLLRSEAPGLRGPLEIIASAERQRRTLELGRHVRAAAAAMAERLPRDCRLFVNLHPDDVLDPAWADAADPLAAHADRVSLELTERARLDDVPGVPEALGALRRRGYQVAIDDLGCGYSGLSSFARLNPNIIKLDRSLVEGVDRDRLRAAVIRAMVELCREVGVDVVAEGVETVGERDCLVGLGCDLLQGYLFGRPEKGFNAVAPSRIRHERAA